MTVNATYGFGQVAHAVCADSGSGIATCNVPDPLDTSSVGTKTIQVHAEDRAGHSFDATLTYEVRSYTFTGFFPPIDNLPTSTSRMQAAASRVKFSLSGYRGLNLFAAGYPASLPITCPNGGGMTSKISPPGGSTLQLQPAGRPVQVWLADGSALGTCRS